MTTNDTRQNFYDKLATLGEVSTRVQPSPAVRVNSYFRLKAVMTAYLAVLAAQL